jgi:hypothetical protein
MSRIYLVVSVLAKSFAVRGRIGTCSFGVVLLGMSLAAMGPEHRKVKIGTTRCNEIEQTLRRICVFGVDPQVTRHAKSMRAGPFLALSCIKLVHSPRFQLQTLHQNLNFARNAKVVLTISRIIEWFFYSIVFGSLSWLEFYAQSCVKFHVPQWFQINGWGHFECTQQ